MAFSLTTTPIQKLIDSGWLLIGDGYRAKNDELSSTGLPFARAQNINGGFRLEGADCYPEEALFKVGNKVSQPGDVVFTSKGTGGRFAFVTDILPQFVYSPQLCFWRSLDNERIYPSWLFYWMQGHEFYQQYKVLPARQTWLSTSVCVISAACTFQSHLLMSKNLSPTSSEPSTTRSS